VAARRFLFIGRSVQWGPKQSNPDARATRILNYPFRSVTYGK
jgi:hypothetical protein